MTRSLAWLALVSLVACSNARSGEIEVRPAQVVPGTTPYTGDQNYFPDDRNALDPDFAHKPVPTIDLDKGDKEDSEWVPAEFKSGAARWKDAAVYVDGKAVGFLTWGELPLTLAPTWVRDKVSANKRPGTNDPGWRWAQQRLYKFTDYLKAVGVDVRKVKELHVYGPRLAETLVVTGAELQSPLANQFLFRFGGAVFGKPLPKIPEGFGRGRNGDKIASVMVYVNKKPPVLTEKGLELDGVPQLGVPYFGEPIRGGVRIYLDTQLAAIIKRQELDPKGATTDAEGELHWKLADVLRAQGVDASKVVELWVIRNERRTEKLPGSALAELTFAAGAQAKGGVLLGDQKLRANAIALSTRAIPDSELPVITPDDE